MFPIAHAKPRDADVALEYLFSLLDHGKDSDTEQDQDGLKELRILEES